MHKFLHGSNLQFFAPKLTVMKEVTCCMAVDDAETQKEEGCEDYYLLKPVTDNVTFYIFGRWTSQAAYAEHFKSAHTRKLLDFDQDKGIIFYIQPLLVVD